MTVLRLGILFSTSGDCGAGGDALIARPRIGSVIYAALVMATRRYAEARHLNKRVAKFGERVRPRPLVHAAVRTFMAADGCDENEAWGRLRREAIQKRLTLKQAAAFVLASPRRQAE
jgi:AmiR/NasT family two-component response regulator